MNSTTTTAIPSPLKHNTAHLTQRRTPSPTTDSNGRRRSVFTEVGLNDIDDVGIKPKVQDSRPGLHVRFGSKVQVHGPADETPFEEGEEEESSSAIIQNPPPQLSRSMTYVRLTFFAFLLAFLIPAVQTWTVLKPSASPIGATAGPLPRVRESNAKLIRRTDTDTDICTRWSQQSALVNGTLYVYGGQATTQAGQVGNTWSKFSSSVHDG